MLRSVKYFVFLCVILLIDVRCNVSYITAFSNILVVILGRAATRKHTIVGKNILKRANIRLEGAKRY